MSRRDTICAIATAAGRGGVGIVRVSGPAASAIASGFIESGLPQPRRATFVPFCDATGLTIDEGIALYFPAPHSYTGEDVLELQGHGGPVVLEMLLSRAIELGARRARPGEFTERAFLNDKLDLAQAEAVADLIDAGSVAAARAALRSLQGEFSQQVHSLVEALIELRTWVEAAIDFPEEEIDFLADTALVNRLDALQQRFSEVTRSAKQGRLLRDGMTVVIAGRPNAGKSSVLNALAGYEAAIVTPVAGTTRDVLREHIAIDGMPLHVLDTAGLRTTADIVEAEGIRRARAEIAKADRVLFIVDATTDPDAEAWRSEQTQWPEWQTVTLVFNKIDALSALQTSALSVKTLSGVHQTLTLSAKQGVGLDRLREHLKACMGYEAADTGTISARARHLDALQRADRHTDNAVTRLKRDRAGELVAEELRLAQAALGEITGEFQADDLLGRIFSNFCIGK
jgi:tRNA modification GTPase